MSEIPVEMLDGVMECTVDDCGHMERFFHPVAGLMSMQTHCEEEHGISESEFVESLDVEETPSQ